jgi:hypothetical protein
MFRMWAGIFKYGSFCLFFIVCREVVYDRALVFAAVRRNSRPRPSRSWKPQPTNANAGDVQVYGGTSVLRSIYASPCVALQNRELPAFAAATAEWELQMMKAPACITSSCLCYNYVSLFRTIRISSYSNENTSDIKNT